MLAMKTHDCPFFPQEWLVKGGSCPLHPITALSTEELATSDMAYLHLPLASRREGCEGGLGLISEVRNLSHSFPGEMSNLAPQRVQPPQRH